MSPAAHGDAAYIEFAADLVVGAQDVEVPGSKPANQKVDRLLGGPGAGAAFRFGRRAVIG